MAIFRVCNENTKGHKEAIFYLPDDVHIAYRNNVTRNNWR